MGNIVPIVITLFNSPNCGAFLQAFALGKYLEKVCGHKVTYYDTGARSLKQNVRKDLRNAIRYLNPEYFLFERRRLSKYAERIKAFDSISYQTSFASNDFLVFGSDEIWNIQRNEISKYPALWGRDFEGGYRISYAPSANGADLEMNDKPPMDFAASIASFEALSARDLWTASALERIVKRHVEVVCDPSLLLSCDEYRMLQTSCPHEQYLLVYSYGGAMTPEDIEQIKKFAHDHELTTISSGTYLSWCDISLPSDPMEFLGLIDGAAYVVTDTFHGSVFSYIYHKNFASIARKNDKVISFLREAGLDDRDPYRNGKNELTACLEKRIDYCEADKRIGKLRESSMRFLDRCVRDCFLTCEH